MRKTEEPKRKKEEKNLGAKIQPFFLFPLPHQGPSRGSRGGILLAVNRRAERLEQAEAGSRVIDAYEALKEAFKSGEGTRAREENCALFMSLMPPAEGRGRQTKQPGAELLPSQAHQAASRAAVGKTLGVPPAVVEAACS